MPLIWLKPKPLGLEPLRNHRRVFVKDDTAAFHDLALHRLHIDGTNGGAAALRFHRGDAAGLTDFVKGALDPKRPVVINVIGFGGDPDRPAWEAITRLSGGSYQEIATSDSPELAATVARMVP